MYTKILSVLSLIVSVCCQAQNVGIGTATPASSAQLEVNSNARGFLPPRLTNVQRNGITSPVAGLMIWNSDCKEAQIFNGTIWTNMIGDTACATYLPKIVTTTTPSNISVTTATSGGSIGGDGGFAIVSRGIVWDTLHNPSILLATKTTNGTGIGNFASNVTNLLSNKLYYLKAYATNSAGTTYGNELSFTTLQQQAPIVFDTVRICNQTWTQRNLDVVTYRNGDTIPEVTDGAAWANLTTGAWCYPVNSPQLGAIYGKLYNWYALNDPRGLAPTGWHVSTDAEWSTLENCLGVAAGGALKEMGYEHWLSPNTGAMNTSGFTGLPGGLRYQFGPCVGCQGEWDSPQARGYFWTSTPTSSGSGIIARQLSYTSYYIFPYSLYYAQGASVRCVKD
jgi:uncharacterized protein (TIGR02145 family)